MARHKRRSTGESSIPVRRQHVKTKGVITAGGLLSVVVVACCDLGVGVVQTVLRNRGVRSELAKSTCVADFLLRGAASVQRCASPTQRRRGLSARRGGVTAVAVFAVKALFPGMLRLKTAAREGEAQMS
jgi:hypothetical protein